jgi:hypothetical protein
MKRLCLVGVLAGLAMAFIGTAAAQNSRSFVSGQGSDTNACSLAAPCRSFARAITVTNSGGEITVLDSAGYGVVSIGIAISIVNPGGVEAGITAPSGQPAITVNTVNGAVVQLRGLTLDGGGVASDGIVFRGGGRLEIVDCVIRNFAHDGINLAPGSGFNLPGKTFSITNTISSDNGSSGIEIAPLSAFSARGVIDRATTSQNGQSGILIDGTNATNNGFVDIAIANSISDSNGTSGFTAQAVGNEKVEIKNSTSSNNALSGLAVSNAKVGLSTTSLVVNGSGFSITNSGTIFTFGDNIIENNRDPNTGTLTPVSRQ